MLYKFRRVYSVLVLVLALFSLYGCVKPATEKSLIEQVADQLFNDIDKDNITSNINFPSIVQEVTITYLSSDRDVISKDGKVTRGLSDKSVEIFAFFKYQEKSLTRSYFFIVKKDSSLIPEGPKDLIDYYKGAEGLTSDELKSFLHDLIDDHTSLGYSSTTNALRKTDEDPNNPDNVILFYTGRSQSKSKYGSGGDLWDKEHVWAKSHGNFGTTAPAGTDLHHLRPTDSSVNGTRSSKDFDEGGSKVIDTYGIDSSFSYYDSDSFEPRDEVKGDVARILFYMAVRYEGDVNGEPDLEINERVNNGTAPYIGKLSILLKWHLEDPVDDFERNRNEVIFSYQKNRNPFIDYPEFIYLIWGN